MLTKILNLLRVVSSPKPVCPVERYDPDLQQAKDRLARIEALLLPSTQHPHQNHA